MGRHPLEILRHLPGRLGGALAALGGANLVLLPTLPDTERRRLQGLGGTVVTVGAMAALSMTFLLRAALHAPLWLAALLGLGWGTAIGNLDRLLIATIRRGQSPRQAITLGVCRVLLAALLGLVVSTPLVLQAFDKEIAVEMASRRSQDKREFQEKLAADPRFVQIPALQAQQSTLRRQVDQGPVVDATTDPTVKDLTGRRDAAATAYHQAAQAVVGEAGGDGVTHVMGCGPVCQLLVDQRDQRKQELDAFQTQLDTAAAAARTRLSSTASVQLQTASGQHAAVTSTLDRLAAARDAEVAAFDARVNVSDGLLSRLAALHSLARRDSLVLGGYLVLTLALVAVDLFPLISKMFLLSGPPTRHEQAEHAEQADAQAKEDLAALRREGDLLAAKLQRDTDVEVCRQAAGHRVDDQRAARELELAKRQVEHEAALRSHETLVQAVQDTVTEQQLAEIDRDVTQFLVP